MEHMSVGVLAKRAKVSVRTLQYYDKLGLLKPSSISEGGREDGVRNPNGGKYNFGFEIQ